MRRVMRNTLINDALTRLARAETEFLGSAFLAPVVRGHGVTVRIAGVRCTLRVIPPAFHGWGVFRPVSHAVATHARPATSAERRRYLSMLPAVRLVAMAREGGRAAAVPAKAGDAHFEIGGSVEVQLGDDVELFETIVARYDGAQFWFDEPDARGDAAAAAYLRRELAAMTAPARLELAGLTGGQRAAYSVAHARRVAAAEADERSLAQQRLGLARAHAGARLRDLGAAAGESD